MNFEKAIETLAARHPKLILVMGDTVLTVKNGVWESLFRFGEETQDAIDSILSLIGWEYMVDAADEIETGKPVRKWGFDISLVGSIEWIVGQNYSHPTKLEAAKAAFVAIVERETQ